MSEVTENQPQTLFTLIKSYSKAIDDGRHPYQVLAKQFEEMGELATEVNISQGYMRRAAGKDGVLGEAGDILVTTIDQALLAKPDLTEQEFMAIIKKKLDKWYSMCAKPIPVSPQQLSLEL